MNTYRQNWSAYFQYNLQDVCFTLKAAQRFYEACRRELMPRFGSAWENMMEYYYNRSKVNE